MSDINFRVFEKIATIDGIDIRVTESTVNFCGGIIACKTEDDGQFLIAVTQEFLNFGDIDELGFKATIMHEVGHIKLGHLDNVTGMMLDGSKEIEADLYALRYVDKADLKRGLAFAATTAKHFSKSLKKGFVFNIIHAAELYLILKKRERAVEKAIIERSPMPLIRLTDVMIDRLTKLGISFKPVF